MTWDPTSKPESGPSCSHCGGPTVRNANAGRYYTCLSCRTSNQVDLTLPLLRSIIDRRESHDIDWEGVDFYGEHHVNDLLELADHIRGVGGSDCREQVRELAMEILFEGPEEPPASTEYLWSRSEKIYEVLKQALQAAL